MRSFCRRFTLVFLGLALATSVFVAQGAESAGKIVPNLAYKAGENLTSYERERCQLDLYLPASAARGFATLVWFHGGGLTGGGKDTAEATVVGRRLAQNGIAVALVNYRLSPKAKFPAYVEDTAAAFAWVKANIARHGGDASAVYLGGHSAGAYLALMAGLDPRYLQRHQLGLDAIAGLVPVSCQTMTHYTIRQERGLEKNIIIADDAAPIHFARKVTPPLLVLWADHDMASRAEENAYFVAALRAVGNTVVQQRVAPNRDHGSIIKKIAELDDVVTAEIVRFIRRKS